MKVWVEVLAPGAVQPTQRDMQRNVNVMKRAIEDAPPSMVQSLKDTLSIIEAIQKQLPL